jgi:hypothetical protein
MIANHEPYTFGKAVKKKDITPPAENELYKNTQWQLIPQTP